MVSDEIRGPVGGGALATFLLIGFLWTIFYQVADRTLLGAFEGLNDDTARRDGQLYYFSFVTLTTLGYGDVTPTAPETMSIAALQAIIGQL